MRRYCNRAIKFVMTLMCLFCLCAELAACAGKDIDFRARGEIRTSIGVGQGFNK